MRNLILAFMGIALIFSACGKYEEGPSFSLASKKARVAGEWVVDKVIVDGTEQTLDDVTKSMVSTLEKDGTGSMSMTILGVTVTTELEWKFNDDKTKLLTRTKNATTGEWSEWDEGSEILKLKSKEIWLKDVETTLGVTVTTETHMKAK